MRLIVHELVTTLYQEITVGAFPIMVEAIRPHLLVFNKAGLGAGTLTVRILDANGKRVAVSETLNIADLTTLAYAHKYYRFYINAGLRAGATYRVALVAGGGYTFSEAAYIAWCNGWEHRRNSSSYNFGEADAPLDFEIWERKEFRRGVA